MPGIDVALNRREILLSAVESLYGIDRAPQETNSYQAIRTIEPFVLDLSQEVLEQTGGLNTLGFSRPFGTVRPVGISYKTFVQGTGGVSYSATVKPPAGDLIRSCGYLETFVSSNAQGRPMYSYKPLSRVQSQCSMTFVANVDGYEHRIIGAMGNVNFVGVAATPFVAEWNFRGQLSTEASTTRGTPVGLPTATPARWVGSGSVFVQSLAAVIENLNANTGNRIFEQRASNALSGSGIIKCLITERQPGGSVDPEATNAGSFDWVNVWRSSSGAQLYAQAGVAQGECFAIVSSQAVFKTLARQDKTGLATFGIGWNGYEVAGDDDIEFRFF